MLSIFSALILLLFNCCSKSVDFFSSISNKKIFLGFNLLQANEIDFPTPPQPITKILLTLSIFF